MAKRNDFPLNFKNKFYINITPEEETPSWALISDWLATADPNFEDNTDDTSYWSGEGFGNLTVLGINASITLSGHRLYGDPAQDYIVGLSFNLGSGRETQFKWTQPDKKTLIGDVTVSDIKASGGDANAKSEFECKVTFNGRPTFEDDDTAGGVAG